MRMSDPGVGVLVASLCSAPTGALLRCAPTRALIISLLLVLPSCSCGDNGDLTALNRILVVDRDEVDVGEAYVGGRRVASITITNQGTGPARLDAPRIDDDAFTVAGVPEGLAAGGQATFTVELRPTRVAEFTASLVIDNDADAPVVVALRGVGLSPLDCDDDNGCTDDTFDPFAGFCVRTNRADGSS